MKAFTGTEERTKAIKEEGGLANAAGCLLCFAALLSAPDSGFGMPGRGMEGLLTLDASERGKTSLSKGMKKTSFSEKALSVMIQAAAKKLYGDCKKDRPEHETVFVFVDLDYSQSFSIQSLRWTASSQLDGIARYP